MVDGEIADEGWGIIASPLIHVSIHMEMDWIVSHCLLAHMLQLHPRNMNGLEAALHLRMIADESRSLLQRAQCIIHTTAHTVITMHEAKTANGCFECMQ